MNYRCRECGYEHGTGVDFCLNCGTSMFNNFDCPNYDEVCARLIREEKKSADAYIAAVRNPAR